MIQLRTRGKAIVCRRSVLLWRCFGLMDRRRSAPYTAISSLQSLEVTPENRSMRRATWQISSITPLLERGLARLQQWGDGGNLPGIPELEPRFTAGNLHEIAAMTNRCRADRRRASKTIKTSQKSKTAGRQNKCFPLVRPLLFPWTRAQYRQLDAEVHDASPGGGREAERKKRVIGNNRGKTTTAALRRTRPRPSGNESKKRRESSTNTARSDCGN